MNYWDKIVALFKGKETKPPIPGMDAKTSLILILIKMAKADGQICHFEQMNIHLLSNTLGVNMQMVNQYRDKLDEVVLVVPESKREKVDYFWRILNMMKMDLYAHPAELKMCKELGLALGFKKKKVEEAVQYMQDRMDKVVGFEELEVVMM